MMRFEPSKVMEEFNNLFGLETITPEQCMFLTKFSKHVRGRCRSNSALMNYLKQSFPGLSFSEVPREWKGKSYMAFQITSKSYAPVVEEDTE